jgi:hypothetical protein
MGKADGSKGSFWLSFGIVERYADRGMSDIVKGNI